MKIWLIVLIPLMVGVAAGLATTRAEFLAVKDVFEAAYEGSLEDVTAETLDAPRAEVLNGTEFDFGTMSMNESRTRDFLVKNTGTVPLDVDFRTVSCGKCMSTDLVEMLVLPGETKTIPVRYATLKQVPRFREWLEIGTSDPSKGVLRFTITGNISEVISLSDDQLHVDSLTSNETYQGSFEIYGFHSDQLEIADHDWSDPSTAHLFAVEFRPSDPAKLAGDPPAKAAVEAVVTIQPGLPVGAITQALKMTAEAGKTVELEMPIAGTVVSDISIAGPNFTRDTNLLRLGTVPRDKGKSVKLQIMVKGPDRHTTTLGIASVDPDQALDVTIGEPTTFNQGAVYMYPFVIEVPPGAPVVNRRGTEQAKLAKIILETSLANAKQVVVYVSFAIE